jgi:tetratricopeptide (TPR) repeat protein
VLGCLSKEHAFVLPLLLIAAEATVLATETPLRSRLAAIRPLILALGLAGLITVWLRIQVLGSTAAPSDDNNALFLGQPFSIRAMTMLRVLLEWIRLFFWPAHLSADYSPRAIDIVTGPNSQILASAAILAGVLGLAWTARRAAPVATFAVLWTGIALLIPSNLLIPTGFVLAERTLFVASGGVMLGVAAVVAHFLQNGDALSASARKLVLGGVGAVLLLGLVVSGLRQRVWRDDDTLFAQTVVDAPASYKAHMAYAIMLFNKHRRKDAFEEIRIAHALFPKDLSVLEYAGEEYSSVEGCHMALGIFAHILAEDPSRAEARVNLAKCLIALGKHADARKTIRQGLATGESLSAFRRLMVVNDSVEASVRFRAGK